MDKNGAYGGLLGNVGELTYGSYGYNQTHELDSKIIDDAIAAFEGAGARFSHDFISDANVRSNYALNIKRVASEVKELVNQKKITVKEAAEFCYEMRNKIMAESRTLTSPQMLAFAEKEKAASKTLEELMDKYANKKFNSNFSMLSSKQKSIIHYEIIESSARDNPKFTFTSKVLKVFGKVIVVITASLAVYEVANSENKIKETAKQAMIIGGGFAGGALAGLAVSAVCGPGAPVCAVATVLIGSVIGGILGESASDYLDEEIEEFTKWNIN